MYIVKSATNLEVSKHDQSRASIEFHMILGNFAQDSHTYKRVRVTSIKTKS